LNEGRIYNLRKIQAVIADSVEDQILKFIYYPKQVLTEGRHLGVLRGGIKQEQKELRQV
jgi:hypothetical protein